MKAIKTLEDLFNLACQSKSIYCEASPMRVFPASVMLSMTGVTILRYFHRGVFEYEPQQRKYPSPWKKRVDVKRKGHKVEASNR